MAPDRDRIVERAVALAAGGSGVDGAADLIRLAAGERAPLEAAHNVLVDRLARRSDDFEATRALRLVNRALERVGWPEPVAG